MTSHIGVVTIGKEHDEAQVKELAFDSTIEKIEIVSKEQIKDVVGLIIELSYEADILEVVEWLVIDTEGKGLFVWILCKECSMQARQLFRNFRDNLIIEFIDSGREMEELPSMVRNAMNYRNSEKSQNQYVTGNVCLLDSDRLCLRTEHQDISLTVLEFQLFTQLIENENKVVLYETLYKHLWPEKQTELVKTQLANLILRLRQKLDYQNVYEIIVVRNSGYMLKEVGM